MGGRGGEARTELMLRLSKDLLAILIALLELGGVGSEVARAESERGLAKVEAYDEPALVAEHARDARGRGVAGQLCEHSQREAIAVGFRAMQYNLVVATNTGAIRLWQRHGFDIVGRLPGAFRHPTQGEVDALVMYKRLVEAAAKA